MATESGKIVPRRQAFVKLKQILAAGETV